MNTPVITTREELIRLLFETITATRRGMHMQGPTDANDTAIPRAQLDLLFTVHYMQPISFKDAAQRMQLTPGAVSQLADALEQAGYIGRHANEADRRIQYLTMTASGYKIVASAQEKRAAFLSSIMDELTDDELMTWLKVQRKILERFQIQTETT